MCLLINCQVFYQTNLRFLQVRLGMLITTSYSEYTVATCGCYTTENNVIVLYSKSALTSPLYPFGMFVAYLAWSGNTEIHLSWDPSCSVLEYSSSNNSLHAQPVPPVVYQQSITCSWRPSGAAPAPAPALSSPFSAGCPLFTSLVHSHAFVHLDSSTSCTAN